VRSVSYPFLRHVVSLGESWDAFLARGTDEPRELVEATAAAVVPSDAAVLFFSSGVHQPNAEGDKTLGSSPSCADVHRIQMWSDAVRPRSG